MDIKNIDFAQEIRLLIDGEEMIFENKITIEDHPSNFSSITFTNVLPKKQKTYPQYMSYQHFAEVFSIGEVYVGNRLIFFGIVNATGRLSFNKNSIKSKAIKIVDFRKWLSIKRPVDLIFFKKSPEYIVNELVIGLDEPRIIVGNLNFTNTEMISAYSIINKSPFSVLKDVIASQTNSFLYFEITQDKKISINFKSVSDFENLTVSPDLNLNNLDSLANYRIENIDVEFDNDDYVNDIIVESQNIVSDKNVIEFVQINKNENLLISNNIGSINTLSTNNFLAYRSSNTLGYVVVKKHLDIISSSNIDQVRWDLKYQGGSNTLTINQILLDGLDPTKNYFIALDYYPQTKVSLEKRNIEEINRIGNLSNTKGDVCRFDKYDDITAFNDLVKIANSEVEKNSKITRTITIQSTLPIWNVADIVKVISTEKAIEDCYLVQTITADLNVSLVNNKTYFTSTFTTILKSTANTNSWLNLFDNQSYRSNPLMDANTTIEIRHTDDELSEIICYHESEETSAKWYWLFANTIPALLVSAESSLSVEIIKI